jgi:hypothetical protein
MPDGWQLRIHCAKQRTGELMQLYHLVDRPRAAMVQYETLCQFLYDELGIEPSAATSSLYHEIVTGLEEVETPHLPAAASPPPMLRDLTHLPFLDSNLIWRVAASKSVRPTKGSGRNCTGRLSPRLKGPYQLQRAWRGTGTPS